MTKYVTTGDTSKVKNLSAMRWALLFAAECFGGNDAKFFNAVTGTLIRSITSNGKGPGLGQFNDYIRDVCISTTGPYFSNVWLILVMSVFDPLVEATSKLWAIVEDLVQDNSLILKGCYYCHHLFPEVTIFYMF